MGELYYPPWHSSRCQIAGGHLAASLLLFQRLLRPTDSSHGNCPEDAGGTIIYLPGTYPLQEGGYLGTDFKVRPLVQDGFAVFTYDMIGFGTRIPEVERFYERFPHWSLMGKMVDDVRSAVDLLSGNDRIDSRRIYVMGYSLGATVGLLATALDDRIAGAISFCGFTPLRTEKGTGSLDNDAFIHGLIPRLGFFKGNEKRLPWDFDEAMALIAPRPLLVVAPQFDQEATFDDVKRSVEVARQVYEIANPEERSAEAPTTTTGAGSGETRWRAMFRCEVWNSTPRRTTTTSPMPCSPSPTTG